MPHALSGANVFFKNKSGVDAWRKVCAYACMMRAEKHVYVRIKVTNKTNDVLVNEHFATSVYIKSLNKFDNMFSWLKSWCEKLALERDVQAVEFEIVTPTKERKFLGKQVKGYTLPSTTDHKQLYIQWPLRDNQNNMQEHGANTEQA